MTASVPDDGMSTGRRFVLEVPALASQHVEALAPNGDVDRSGDRLLRQGPVDAPAARDEPAGVTGRSWPDDRAPDASRVPSVLRVSVSVPMASGGRWTRMIVPPATEDGTPTWLEHPVHGASVDVVAVPAMLDEAVDDVDIVSYPLNPAPVRLGLTDTVYVVGFLVGFDPVVAPGVLGLWTRGTVAWDPRLDWRGLPAMLLDCRTRHGQSGSPVSFYASVTMDFVGVDGAMRRGPARGLVGVYSGRIHEDSDVGIVWKRSAVEEVVLRGVRPDRPLVTELAVPPEGLVPHLPGWAGAW